MFLVIHKNMGLCPYIDRVRLKHPHENTPSRYPTMVKGRPSPKASPLYTKISSARDYFECSIIIIPLKTRK